MKFFTIEQASTMLAVSEKFVRRLIDKGLIIPHKFESAVRISEADLMDYVVSRRVVNGKPPRKAARPKLNHVKLS